MNNSWMDLQSFLLFLFILWFLLGEILDKAITLVIAENQL
jgi:hypothetical protein